MRDDAKTMGRVNNCCEDYQESCTTKLAPDLQESPSKDVVLFSFENPYRIINVVNINICNVCKSISNHK